MFARFLSDIVRSAQQFGSRRISYIFRNYASTLPQRSIETVSLPVGGNGFVELEILRPQASTKSNNNNILVHLPAGPRPSGTIQRTGIFDNIHDLAPHFQNATLIDIHYRLGPRDALSELDYRFPTPIHDVFTAWDYVTDAESPHNQLNADQQEEAAVEPRICLYGSHIGGALALALTLTNPNQILALAVEEPLVDWVILDELMTHEGAMTRMSPALKKARNAKAKQEEYERIMVAARELVKLRTSLFRTPSGFFDSFASPVLFLRAPGRDTPTTQSAAPEEDVLGGMRLGEEVQENGLHKIGYGDQAFGPYDDDWHTAHMSKHTEGQGISYLTISDRSSRAESVNQANGQPFTDLSYWTPDGVGLERSSSPRRRKVLRRWPSLTTSEEALLPYVNILFKVSQPMIPSGDSDALDIDIPPVTHAQGVELLDLLRRACFWGREKGFAEERVISTELSTTNSESQDKLVQWLQMRFANG